jgi:hypothetical protein
VRSAIRLWCSLNTCEGSSFFLSFSFIVNQFLFFDLTDLLNACVVGCGGLLLMYLYHRALHAAGCDAMQNMETCLVETKCPNVDL